MSKYSALKGGVAAAAMTLAFAHPASAAGLGDIFSIFQPSSPAQSYQASTEPLQEGRSVATTGTDADLAGASQKMTRVAVEDPTEQNSGTITIDTKNRFLYLSMPGHEAMRYSIGVGRDGFRWSGEAHVERKAEWPDWHPPKEMIARRPDIPHYMAGGIGNPLGARAMYLFNGKGDTGYRIHGTNEPDSIGQAVSSGCIRMMNNDVIDLYGRVKPGTKVIVLPG